MIIIFFKTANLVKKVLLIIFLFSQGTALIAQDSLRNHSLATENFLVKSKKQKKAARICMGAGVGFLALTFLTVISPPTPGDDNDSRGYITTNLSLASFATGAYLHIASRKNRKRAAQSSVFFDVKKSAFLSQARIINPSYPAIGFKINL